MSPVEAGALVLAADIERDWQQVEKHVMRAESVAPTEDGPEAAYLALALDHAYQVFETLLVRIERYFGLPRREGSGRHRGVLAEAALPVPKLRPALIPAEVEQDWGELLAFRHFLRHAYSFDLDAPRLLQLRERLRRASSVTGPLLTRFVIALRAD